MGRKCRADETSCGRDFPDGRRLVRMPSAARRIIVSPLCERRPAMQVQSLMKTLDKPLETP